MVRRFRCESCTTRRFPGSAAAVLAVLLMATQVVAAPTADRGAAAARRPATLADRLKADLRVKLPEDEEYCERVAALVEEGRLPERLVTSTQAWAAAKGRKYPFQLFRKALETKADRLGLLP